MNADEQASRNNRSKLLLLSCIFFGLLFVVLSLVAHNHFKQNPGWKQTEGVVIDTNPTTRQRGGVVYTPTVSYRLAGKTYEVTSTVSSAYAPDIGARVAVSYDPMNPGRSRLHDNLSTTLIFLMYPTIAFIVLVASVVYIVQLHRTDGITAR